MNNNQFTPWPTLLNQTILDHIVLAAQQNANCYVAFDADGTLWDGDAGETFFEYLIHNQLVSLPPNPLEHYKKLKEQHPPTAYLWLAQICAGQNISTVQKWAKDSFAKNSATKSSSLKIYPNVFNLIKKIIDLNIPIYIVTASVSWAVEPGEALLGLQNASV
jgi:phosphoserine phosphatase